MRHPWHFHVFIFTSTSFPSTILAPSPPHPQIFATHWSAVASALQGVPGLLGYEMLNEPWSAPPYNATTATTTIGAETAASEKSLPPAFSDQASLGTFYDTLHAAVRAVVRCRIALFVIIIICYNLLVF